jgi:hypothetical protein
MKIAALSILSLLLASAAGFAGVDLGASARSTPYDAYMHSVKQILGTLHGSSAEMSRVNTLMREGRNFRYSFTEPYQAALPSVTASTHSGDCKAKALWLCEEMGDQNVRFVVGKMHANSKMSHAWVLWQHEGRYWILDCTNTSRPIAADTVSSRDYIPLFSWGKNGTYRHFGAEAALAGVAGKRGTPVAANTGR